MTEMRIVWFRQDLRLADNEAIAKAAEDNAQVAYVFIHDENLAWKLGGASRWWLHHSLTALSQSLNKQGHQLVLRSGDTKSCLAKLVEETGATQIFWNRRYDPHLIDLDKELKLFFEAQGVACKSYNALLMREPWETKNLSGEPYQVFTPFWKARLKQGAAIGFLNDSVNCGKAAKPLATDELASWSLLPKIKWDASFYAEWTPGETGALESLSRFDPIGYGQDRNRPDLPACSRLSPHLHFGEISPTRIWKETLKRFAHEKAEAFLRELGWRDFSYYLLYFFPQTPTKALKPIFEKMAWSDRDNKEFRAWCRGRTGYPIVDAGMRQLWATGWMHNRVRMVVASFLVKHLMISWRKGAEWFWDTLVDADLASNTQGWQWAGGCGADAAPFFRIFNPVLQGEKFDPKGDYVRRWVPELEKVPTKWIHQPWTCEELAEYGVQLGKNYPHPMVDHKKARDRALQAYQSLKSEKVST